MKQIVLHMGMRETGTSSVQAFLAANRAALKERSIDYLELGESKLGLEGRISPANGSLLARTLLHPDAPARIPDGQQHHAQLHAAVGNSRADIGIVSSEYFVDAAREKLEKFLAPLRSRGLTIKAFYHIRRQDQFLNSAYMRRVKQHGYTDHPETVVRTMYRATPFLKYHSYYRHLADIFGRRHIICRIYDTAIRGEGGLYSDFLSALGVDGTGFVTEMPGIDTGLSPEYVAIMLTINRYRPRTEFSDFVENGATNGATKGGVQHRLLPQRLLEEIDAFFRAENTEMAQEYFDRPKLFEAPAPDSGPADPITAPSLSFEDMISFFGGLVVRYDQRMLELDQRLAETGRMIRALRAERPALASGKR